MSDSEDQAPERVERRRGVRRIPRFRLNAIWIAVVLILILSLAQLIGILIHNLNQTRMGAIFAIGVVSFLGTLSLGHQGLRFRLLWLCCRSRNHSVRQKAVESVS